MSLSETEQRRDTTGAEIDAEADKTTTQRAELAATLPAELVALYEKIRASSGGVGAAALHRGRCEPGQKANGAGTLLLGGNNSYSGNTTAAGGVLAICG